jgi:hypothetical protein
MAATEWPARMNSEKRRHAAPNRRSAPAPRDYSSVVAPPALEPSHFSNASWLSTMRNPEDMLEWLLPQSWAQLI